MEILIVLVVIGIIIYVIYESLPSTKFNKANALLITNNLSGGIAIFESIFYKHPDAPAKLAEGKFKQGSTEVDKNKDKAIELFNQIIEIKKRIPSSANIKLYELIQAKSFLEISRLNFNVLLEENNSQVRQSRINTNLDYITDAVKTGVESEFSDLETKHFSQLAELNFSFGLTFEKSNHIGDAMQSYLTANNFATTSSNAIIKTNSTVRGAICKLKRSIPIESNLFEQIDSASTELKTDFYYRYAIKLLKEENYSEAEKITLTALSLKSPAIDKLKSIIHAKKVKDAIAHVHEINDKLDKLNENSITIHEIRELYDKLDVQINHINEVLPSLSEKMRAIKPSLFNRLLTYYMSAKEFANAINLIQKYPAFWESPEHLKNLVICSYAFASQGNLNEKNYRIIIANWLTAVYSDNVILRSLEDTSWDDNYTFSLSEAIGSNYYHHPELPENVNYDDISDTNISIGAAQKELLHQFEALLHQSVTNETLRNNIHDFYTSEKDSIEKIVSIIENNILFASPHFAKTYGLNHKIIKELDNDYSGNNNEEALEAGMPYLKNNNGSQVNEYALAKELVKKAADAIANDDVKELNAICSEKNKGLVSKYTSITTVIEDKLFNSIAVKIETKGFKENLIEIMEIAIKFSGKNGKLKYQCSNNIANYCISNVNDGKMDHLKALSLMKNAYFHSSMNPRICNNIVTLIRFNLMNILNGRTEKVNEIYKVLDEIYEKRSAEFQNASSELAKARSEILNELKKAGVDISLLTDSTSASLLWATNINKNLTPQGVKMKKVLDYLKKLSEGQTSTRAADRLLNIRQQLGLDDLPF